MSYKAIVSRIKTFPHPNEKYTRIKCGVVLGHQVVVSTDVENGELGVFFNSDGQLSHRFAMDHKLYRKDPATDESMGGYLEPNRRIKALRLGGVRSEGVFIPMRVIAEMHKDWPEFAEGEQFDAVGDYKVCNKYFTPATLKAIRDAKAGKKVKRGETKWFPKHFDTRQFRYEMNSIPKGALVWISEKLHGTSGRCSNALDEQYVWPWWKKLCKAVGIPVEPNIKIDYSILNGTRNVILEKSDGFGYYGDDTFRYDVLKHIPELLHKGESLYFEIVGYTNNGGKIMPSVDTAKLNDPDFVERYGETMHWKYGCDSTSSDYCKMFVYRITRTNEDGKTTELSWFQVKQRCAELGLDTVPELCDPFVYDGNTEKLETLVSELRDGPSLIDDSHIREGVAIRIEHENLSNGMMVLKDKSFAFKVLEGIIKTQDDYVDEEESC